MKKPMKKKLTDKQYLRELVLQNYDKDFKTIDYKQFTLDVLVWLNQDDKV